MGDEEKQGALIAGLHEFAGRAGANAAALYFPTTAMASQKFSSFERGDYLFRAAMAPDEPGAIEGFTPYLEAWRKGSLGEIAAHFALRNNPGPAIQSDAQGKRWLMLPVSIEGAGPGVAITSPGGDIEIDKRFLRFLRIVRTSHVEGYLRQTFQSHARIAVDLSERMGGINPDCDDAVFGAQIREQLALLAQKFHCLEMTLCLADDALLAQPGELRKSNPSRLYRIRWSTFALDAFLQTDFRAIPEEDGPQGWVLENRKHLRQPGFHLLYGDKDASLRQSPPIDMSERAPPPYLREGMVEDVATCPLLLDGALLGFIRAGFRTEPPYLFEEFTVKAIQAAGQSLVRLVQTRAATKRSVERAETVEAAVSALARLEKPRVAGDASSVKALCLETARALRSVWRKDPVRAMIFNVEFNDSNDDKKPLKLIDPPGAQIEKDAPYHDFSFKSGARASVKGKMRVYRTGAGAAPPRFELTARLFADRLALMLAANQLEAHHVQREEALKERAEHEKHMQNALNEVNHQLITPLKIALDKVDEMLDALPRRSWVDAQNAASTTKIYMRRVHRIARASEVFQALHNNRALPMRKPRKLAPLVVENKVREAVRDIQRLGDGARRAPRFQIDVLKNHMRANWQATFVDLDILDQILFNLLENAFKYSRGASPITVEIGASKSSRPVIRVINEGEEILEPKRLIERGYRDPGVFLRSGEGAGLGLWIVDQVMRRIGGTLLIEPAHSKETRHRFTLMFKKE